MCVQSRLLAVLVKNVGLHTSCMASLMRAEWLASAWSRGVEAAGRPRR